MTEALWRKSAIELGGLLDRGDVTPSQVLDSCLARHAQTHPQLNAIVTLCERDARAAASEADARQRAGRRRSALDGIPVTIKDNLYVRGVRATWGSRLFADFVPDNDDICVERLRSAGAIIVGTTNTPEFAAAGFTDNRVFGPTPNPWNLSLIPGGSSGGAAASVAAGVTPLAVGTDAGGSIRTPASYTGLVGVRPSNARIARRHGFPPIAHDFQVVTPLARTVGDAALLYDALAGPDSRDPASLRFAVDSEPSPPRHTRIRLVTDAGGEPVDREVRASVTAAAQVLASIGCQVTPGPAPYDVAEIREIYAGLASVGIARVVSRFANWQDEVSPNIAAMATSGLALSAADYVRLLDRLASFRAQVAGSWQGYDLVCTPTAATLPWPLGQSHPATIDGRPANARSASLFTTWVNAIGHPAITLPAMPSAGGLPIGMQLVGPFGGERTLFDLATRYEAASPWSQRWPAIASM